MTRLPRLTCPSNLRPRRGRFLRTPRMVCSRPTGEILSQDGPPLPVGIPYGGRAPRASPLGRLVARGRSGKRVRMSKDKTAAQFYLPRLAAMAGGARTSMGFSRGACGASLASGCRCRCGREGLTERFGLTSRARLVDVLRGRARCRGVALTMRRSYLGAVLHIEKTAKRWDLMWRRPRLTQAKREWSAGGPSSGGSWRRKAGVCPTQKSGEGFVYVPLQASLLRSAAFSRCRR